MKADEKLKSYEVRKSELKKVKGGAGNGEGGIICPGCGSFKYNINAGNHGKLCPIGYAPMPCTCGEVFCWLMQ